MGARRWVQDFLCGPRDEKVLLRSLDHLRAAKGTVSWGWGVGAVWNSWLQADLFLAHLNSGPGFAYCFMGGHPLLSFILGGNPVWVHFTGI